MERQDVIARRLVDTNLIVRYLVQDNARQAEAATRLFEACDQGRLALRLLSAVLAECVFVLESVYGHERGRIAEALIRFAESPGIVLAECDIHVDALKRYGNTKLHFVDCLIAANAAAGDIPVATFDKDFRKFPDITVQLE